MAPDQERGLDPYAIKSGSERTNLVAMRLLRRRLASAAILAPKECARRLPEVRGSAARGVDLARVRSAELSAGRSHADG